MCPDKSGPSSGSFELLPDDLSDELIRHHDRESETRLLVPDTKFAKVWLQSDVHLYGSPETFTCLPMSKLSAGTRAWIPHLVWTLFDSDWFENPAADRFRSNIQSVVI